ncbi:hypothetical protein C0992_000684 [Termitomyces sp. T32_za158]|nr:hypothetical protein C0992_000684 [Termitomyces sp. T32_za158]
MIVLLVTKAVGDFLATNGIADEMIRFNGFPLLKKEDHAYNVSEDLLEASNSHGFPIESADSLRHIIGYIGRTELRYVLGALITNAIDHVARLILVSRPRCQFVRRDSEHLTHSVSFGIEEEAAGTSFFESALSEGGLRFWLWVNLVRCGLLSSVLDAKCVSYNGFSRAIVGDCHANIQALGVGLPHSYL